MTREQKRAKAILQFETIAALAKGAIAQLQHSARNEKEMSAVSFAVDQRIRARLQNVQDLWQQQELPL